MKQQLFLLEGKVQTLDDIKDQHIENTNAVTEAAAQVPSQSTEIAPDQQGGSIWLMVIYIVGLVVLFYFFAIKPQKKREKELQEMQSSVKVGDWVMTSSGFYGKVADITDQVFVIEFGMNKGVRVPVKKSEIFANKEPNLTNKPSSGSDGDK